VQLDGGAVIMGIIAGRLWRHKIKVIAGDKGQIEISPYNPTKRQIPTGSSGAID
jgi:translation initiation factor IF-1